MSKKTTVAVAFTATESPVIARKRERRAPGTKKAAPKPEKPALTREYLAKMTAENAKKALDALYPHAVEGKIIDAPEEAETIVMEYLLAHDAASIAGAKKSAAGNMIRFLMGDAEEMHGPGWKTTWADQRNQIDWAAVVKECNIPEETIERFRKPDHRVLTVRETANNEEETGT